MSCLREEERGAGNIMVLGEQLESWSCNFFPTSPQRWERLVGGTLSRVSISLLKVMGVKGRETENT